MTDLELARESATPMGGELWAVVASDRALESRRVVAVMATRAAANSVVRRLVLSRSVGTAWVERVPPITRVLRGEVRL